MIPERPHFDGKHVSKVAMANFDWNVSSGERQLSKAKLGFDLDLAMNIASLGENAKQFH